MGSDLNDRVKILEAEIADIKERNQRVEKDKAWETSLLRKIVITILTYLVIVLYMYSVKIPDHWLNAMVPATAYFISTLTFSVLKKRWVNK
ncbi:MAG: hypothetical protein V1838_03115 [Patescibacteria group bacterium]